MARRPTNPFERDDIESLSDRQSKTEQKKEVQRMAALGEQLAHLPLKQIQQLPVHERLIDALLDVQKITSHEARRRQFQRIGKLLRNEDESVILSYLVPKQGIKKQVQLTRWVERMIEQGDSAVHEFSKQYRATDKHTLRQHVLRVRRDLELGADEPSLALLREKLTNYVQQVALLSETT